MVNTSSLNGSISALTIDVEDGISIAMKDYFNIEMDPTERVVKNVDIILEICSINNVRGTFFVLGEIAEKFPDLIKKIDSEKHEIGIHGYHHDQIFRLTPEKLKLTLLKARKLTEDITGHKVSGFRAPAFSVRLDTSWALETISDCGFDYDSSIYPSASTRYGWDKFPRDICRLRLNNKKSIVEVPLSVTEFMGRTFPVCGGGYLRYYPYILTRNAFKSISRLRPVIVYMHPYELDTENYPDYFYKALSSAGIKKRIVLSYYRLGKNTVRSKLDRLTSEFRFMPLYEIIQKKESSGLLREIKFNELMGV